MKPSYVKEIVAINVAMLCISTSGPLGRYIALTPPVIIAYRAFFALIFLGLFCWWRKYNFRFSIPKDGFTLLLTGILMTVHWLTYFYALKWANVAIGMLSLFTFPVFTALLEPLFFKSKFQVAHLFLSLMILLGIFFIAPSFDSNDTMVKGLLIGLVSALAYAIRNLILKKKIDDFNGSVLMFYQMLVATFIMLPILLTSQETGVMSQIHYLIFLGLVTTAIGHSIFLNSFKYFSVSTASILSSMQPIYGIVLAMLFLQEFPSWRSVIGGLIILLTVVLESRRQRTVP